MTLTYDCTDLWSESFILFSRNGRSLVAHIVVKILKTLRKILRTKFLAIPGLLGHHPLAWSAPALHPYCFRFLETPAQKSPKNHKSHSVYLVFLVNNIFQIRILFIWFVFNCFLLMMCTIAKMYDPTIILEKEPIEKGTSMQCAIVE